MTYEVHYNESELGFQFPAITTDVERAFSLGSLTVTKRRDALSDESVRAGFILASWATIPGIIPEAGIVVVFRNKS